MIRPYRHDDLEGVLDVWHRASLLAHPFLDSAFLGEEKERIKTIYMPMAETWVYVRDGRIAGFIALIESEIGGLFVDPELHGQGTGRALVDFAKTLHAELEVEVFEMNVTGRRFYDRYGFQKVSKHAHKETGLPVLRLRLPQSS